MEQTNYLLSGGENVLHGLGSPGELLLHGVAASSCGITIADATLPDQPLIYVNPAFERLTGYAADEVLGKNCRFLQGNERDQLAAHRVRRSVIDGVDCSVTLLNFRKDGTPFWNDLVISPIKNRAGLTTHFIGVQTDITARRVAEEELQQANEHLEEKVRARTEDLQRAYQATLEGWARALEMRDNDTEGHSQRVTEMTLRLAKRMGLDDDELLNIRRGALLHDIGKIGIPDHILLKPGALTPEEREEMQKHPKLAFQWLEPIEYLRPALEIPYAHHERWDGMGYPNGLAGEAIPLAARVFAIVDVWDALRSDRPYRSGWSDEEVLRHLAEGSGSHFDPRVVEAFLSMLAEDARPSRRAA